MVDQLTMRQSLRDGLRAPARLLTNLSETPENQMAVNLALINQEAPESKRKLQQLKKLEGKILTKLIALATKVYNNRKTPEDKQVQGLRKVLLADKSWEPDG